MFKRTFLGICFFSFINLASFAQENVKDIYSYFDNTVGIENTVLFNGVENIDLQKSIGDKNKFFNSENEFQLGSVTYNNQFFPEIPLKFNVVDDELIVHLHTKNQNSIFKLITEKIQGFSISNKEFQYVSNNSNKDIPAGFYEEIHKSENFRVLKKYQKVSNKKFDRSYLYFEFTFSEPLYFLNYQNEFYQIDSWRDLAGVFPEFKKELRDTSRENKKFRKTDTEAYYKMLFYQTSKLLNQE